MRKLAEERRGWRGAGSRRQASGTAQIEHCIKERPSTSPFCWVLCEEAALLTVTSLS